MAIKNKVDTKQGTYIDKNGWLRAKDSEALSGFDPCSKICTMNCGPGKDDPRSKEERKYLCSDCEARVE